MASGRRHDGSYNATTIFNNVREIQIIKNKLNSRIFYRRKTDGFTVMKKLTNNETFILFF